MANSTHYLAGLTWLRAIAAMVVIFSHVIRVAEDHYQSGKMDIPSVFWALDLGTFGVLLFFTLSGTTLYISQFNKHNDLTTFFIKRWFRIWPAFAVALLTYLAFRPVFATFYPELTGNWIEGQFTAPYTWSNVVQYLAMASNFFAPSGLFNNAFWSLPVEFQYYLCFPILFWLATRFGALGPVLFALFLYSLYKLEVFDIPDQKVFMLGFSFCFGTVIGWLYCNKNLSLTIPYPWLLLVAIFAVAAYFTQNRSALPDIPVLSGIWNCYMILAALAVFIVLFEEPKIPPIILPKLMILGEISYSLYLWHNLVIGALLLVFLHLDFIRGPVPFISMFILSSVITIAISMLSYRYIEKAGMKVGRSLISALNERATKAVKSQS